MEMYDPFVYGEKMLKYDGFVFLDLHKTGCTHIIRLLKNYVGSELLYEHKHRPVKELYCPGDVHTLSVRDPLEQYLSLYRYGLDGQGALYKGLSKLGKSGLYVDSSPESFGRWLDFVFDKDNASLLGEGYDQAISHHEYLGFFSYRLLSLAFRNVFAVLDGVESRDNLEEKIKERSIVDFIIKNERLEEDFLRIIEFVSSDVKVKKLLLNKTVKEISEEIHSLEKTNISMSKSIAFSSESEKDIYRKKVYEKEWVYSLFGYEDEFKRLGIV